ncbi:MAG TPA: TadE/TadG family type IV pilus assembly protein [Dongiaceae bacterium]|jgi:Flp pilus assembly protein TadG|nr:TadE/TadG family type IV pilus assembly protein [Dongiaceae bacterium]
MSAHPHSIRRRRLFGRFRRDKSGVAAIEFALILPILVLLTLGCFEVPRYVLLWQRLERASSGVSDLVAQADEPLTANQMTDIFSAAKVLMQPYAIFTDGSIVVTSINNPTGGSGVKNTWRVACGTVNTTGTLGAVNSTPTNLPAQLSPTLDNEVLVAEIYFNYTPVFKTFIYKGSTLYAVAYTRPRNHNLMTSPGTVRCPT